MSLKDRKKGAETKLTLHTEHSNSWIAEECGISNDTVTKIRGELEATSKIEVARDLEQGGKIPPCDALVGKDGKKYLASILN